MIAILGDIHFSDSKDWLIRVSEEFLDWFDHWELNSPENSLILVGDLVQTSVNGGLVVSYLERLIATSRFKDVHICVGNHDKKKSHGEEQLAYEFYKYKPHVHVYETDKYVDIDGLKVLMLPYFLGYNDLGLTMSEWYSDIPRHPYYEDCDLVVGHFAGEENSFPNATDCVHNLDLFDTKKMCLGHIHTRNIMPERYIGSVYAGRRNENDYTRSAWVWDGHEWREDRLPLFNEFLTVTYPEDLPETKALVPVYTVLNCASESQARERYGDIYIRKVTPSQVDYGSTAKYEVARSLASVKNMDIKELFANFVEEQTPPLSDDVVTECRTALGTMENNNNN